MQLSLLNIQNTQKLILIHRLVTSMKNKENKIKCTFRLKETTHNFIGKEAEQRNISQAAFIEQLIEHYEKSGYLNKLEDITLRTHKSVLYMDRTTQQIAEMLNMICFNLNCKSVIKDDKIKTEIYSQAKDLVNERIRKARINKSDQLY